MVSMDTLNTIIIIVLVSPKQYSYMMNTVIDTERITLWLMNIIIIIIFRVWFNSAFTGSL